jgi:CHAT domain-containing protein/Tfp pilus assembly protein PilF
MANPGNAAASSMYDSLRPLLRSLYLFIFLTATMTVSSATHQQGEQGELAPGQPIEREIAGGETHTYRFTLAVGAQGPEPVSLIAETAGLYCLELRTWQAQAPRGRYAAKIEELRTARPSDKARVVAERAFAEATLIGNRGTAEARRQALEKYRATIPLWQALEDRQQEANTLNTIGYFHYQLAEYQQALAHYRQALSLRQAVSDRRGEALTRYQLGAVYDQLGEPRQALAAYNEALALYRALADRSMEAATLGNLGVVQGGLGEQQKALELFQQALLLKREARDPYGEAILLNNIGLIHSNLGEQQQALDFFNRALPLYRALDNRSGEGTTLNNIANLYNSLGEHRQALTYLEQVLQIKRAGGNRGEEATALNNLGVAFGNLGEHRKALEYYKQALALSRAAGVRSQQATTLANFGKVYSDLNEPRQALDYYQQSLLLRREIGDRRGEATTLNNLGKAYHVLREHTRALDYYNQALALRQAVNDRSGEAVTRYNLARLQRDLNQFAAAHAQIEAALTLVELLRTKVASQGLRTSYLASVQQYYELGIDLLMRLHQQQPTEGFAAAALQISERARARTLLELLTEARADIRQGIAPALLERERMLQQTLDTKAAVQMRLLGGKHTAEQAAAIAKEIAALTTEFEQVQAQIRHTSPRYAALTQPVPLSLKEIQTTLLDENTLLLEYALGEEKSYLWAVTPTALHSYELPKRAEIETAARRVYEALTARNQATPRETPEQKRRRIELADAEYPQAAAALSQMLLAPVAAQLAAKRLLIVSDGVLQYVPFAALPVPKDESGRMQDGKRIRRAPVHPSSFRLNPLIVAHEIVSLPSASVLASLRQEAASRRPAAKTLAVLADPVFQGNDPRLDTPNGMRAGETAFTRLRFSRAEADQLASLSPVGQTLKALDFAANRETATSATLGDYRFVHFATHALINHQHPELSGIVLSQVDERGQPRDGLLRLHEIYNLRLAAELVVLSACETALGKEVKGEGLISLTRGFMYAGAPRVAASLWRTDDRAAAELMKRFYQRMLGEKLSAAAALRAAQVSLWREQRWQAPYFWAAFTLQGEWR